MSTFFQWVQSYAATTISSSASSVEAIDDRDVPAAVGCRKHQSFDHDFFISYRVDISPSDRAESDLALRLEAGLDAAAKRFVPGGIKVYLDRLCIREGARWEQEFVAGLHGSRAVIVLLSRKSWDVMVRHLDNGEPDNVLKEIELAIRLRKKIIPLCIKSENDPDYFLVFKQDLSIFTSPKFDALNQAIQELRKIQMLPIDAQNPQTSLYRILSTLYPVQTLHDAMSTVPRPSILCHADLSVLKDVMTHLALAGHCVLSGISGIGKSTVAQLFVHFAMAKRRLDVDGADDFFFSTALYNKVIWINGMTAETAQGSLRAAFKTKEEEETLKAFRSQIGASSRFLIVFDNVDDVQVLNALFDCLDEGAELGGDYIVTTRLERLPGGAFSRAMMARSPTHSQPVVKVSLWSMETVRDYLFKRCPPLGATRDSSATFTSFLEKVGGYPIVIEQLVAYFDLKQPAVEDLEPRLKAILNQSENVRQTSLVELIKLGLSSLEESQEGRIAILLYGCMGFLDGSGLQSRLLKACVEEICAELGIDPQEIDFLDIISLLTRSGILRQVSAEGTYSIHNLHQTVIREASQRVTSIDLAKSHSTASAAYLKVMTSHGSFSVEQARMTSHVQFLVCHTAKPWTEQLVLLRLLEAQLDEFFSKLESARSKFQKILEELERVFGTKETAVAATALNGMGCVADSQGHFDEALEFYKTSLDIQVKVYGTRVHSDVATTLNYMGLAADSQGHYEEALQYYQESIDIKVKVFGTRMHMAVAATLNNMGSVAYSQGQYQEALQCYKESLDIKTKVLGTRLHAGVATTLNNIGSVADSLGQYDEAFQHYQESLDISAKVFGTLVHPDIATTLNNMGSAKFQQGDRAEALRYYQESLDISVRALGTRQHPDVAATLNNIGSVAESQGRYAEATRCYLESLDVSTKVFGTRQHAVVAATLNNLGSVADSQGRYADAAKYYQESLDIKVAVLGTRAHAIVATTLSNMGSAAESQGLFDEATAHFQEALDISIGAFGSRCCEAVATALRKLGALCFRQGRRGVAVQHLEEALEIMEKVSPSHPDLESTSELLERARDGCQDSESKAPEADTLPS